MDDQYRAVLDSLLKTQDLIRRQMDLHEQQAEHLRKLNNKLEQLDLKSKQTVRSFDALRQASTRPILDKVAIFLAQQQMSMEHTLEWLSAGTGSLARYREREFRFSLDPLETLKMPVACHGIQRDLQTVLAEPVDGLRVGLPQFNRDIFWAGIWTEYWGRLEPYVRMHGTIANSHVTRPIVFQFLKDRAVELWRDTWAGKDINLVTGSKNMLNMSSDLFDSARAMVRTNCRNKNAYQDLKGTLEIALASAADLVLVSLGEAAPVLVRELQQRGVRAIDIGELDASFKTVYV